MSRQRVATMVVAAVLVAGAVRAGWARPIVAARSGTGASPAAHPTFPNAGLLAFACAGCPGAASAVRVFTLRLDGLKVRALANGTGDYEPRWSPDGRTLAVSRDFNEIWLLASNGLGVLPREVVDTADRWPVSQ